MWCSLLVILTNNHKLNQGRYNFSYNVVHASDMLHLSICGVNTWTKQILYFYFKKRCQKDTCYDDIVVCAQDLETILGAIVNILIERVSVISQKLNLKKSLWSLIAFATEL